MREEPNESILRKHFANEEHDTGFISRLKLLEILCERQVTPNTGTMVIIPIDVLFNKPGCIFSDILKPLYQLASNKHAEMAMLKENETALLMEKEKVKAKSKEKLVELDNRLKVLKGNLAELEQELNVLKERLPNLDLALNILVAFTKILAKNAHPALPGFYDLKDEIMLKMFEQEIMPLSIL